MSRVNWDAVYAASVSVIAVVIAVIWPSSYALVGAVSGLGVVLAILALPAVAGGKATNHRRAR